MPRPVSSKPRVLEKSTAAFDELQNPRAADYHYAVGPRVVLLPCLAAIGAIGSFAARQPPAPAAAPHWYKVNTHTHTLNSDGDSTPDDVVKWYREHGYNFLVLSDHNFLTSVDGLNAVHGADGKFLVIRGEEVTDKFGD